MMLMMMMIMLMNMMLMLMMMIMMMMMMIMMMMMRRPSSLRVRAKPRHLPILYTFIFRVHEFVIFLLVAFFLRHDVRPERTTIGEVAWVSWMAKPVSALMQDLKSVSEYPKKAFSKPVSWFS
jgi:hypothetical protein